ncbi:unnamed protein product [Soboliphyme baturini]|uniref:TORC_N domain-containing protein n=1 Tax=Soboliphyme baturini TaxID=241478 RepID=A0A183ITB3_9BILA|nr:unnamed protein product [Soboliphyme baturini]
MQQLSADLKSQPQQQFFDLSGQYVELVKQEMVMGVPAPGREAARYPVERGPAVGQHGDMGTDPIITHPHRQHRHSKTLLPRSNTVFFNRVPQAVPANGAPMDICKSVARCDLHITPSISRCG